MQQLLFPFDEDSLGRSKNRGCLWNFEKGCPRSRPLGRNDLLGSAQLETSKFGPKISSETLILQKYRHKLEDCATGSFVSTVRSKRINFDPSSIHFKVLINSDLEL